jgi:putative tryptophan/tyrosine transport system substrate-binding protein
MMNRRAFVTGVGAVLAAPLAVEAQAGKVWRIGWLSSASPAGLTSERDYFRQAFRDLGYVEGQNVAFEFHWTQSASDRLSTLAIDLVGHKVDAIVAVGPQSIRAAQQATAVIPIVMMTSGDPVSAGFVTNLARPGGNVTGVSFLGEELSGKLLQLLKEAMPKASRVAVLWNPTNTAHSAYWKDVRAAAHALGIELQSLELRAADDLTRMVEQATRGRADALLLLLDPIFTANAQRIVDISLKNRLPTIYSLPQLVDVGDLIGYGPTIAEGVRQAVFYVDKILKGAKPADLPVEQLTKFELGINLKTAKALGLTIPPSLLLRADQIIQ